MAAFRSIFAPYDITVTGDKSDATRKRVWCQERLEDYSGQHRISEMARGGGYRLALSTLELLPA